MGKTTLYHPVSLHVLRGAAQYCGWNISRITQLDADRGSGSASYLCRINRVPSGLADYGPAVILKQFQHCYAQDVKVLFISMTSSGQVLATIAVQLQGDSQESPRDPDKLPWEE